MAPYQNIFTQVQLRNPHGELGVSAPGDARNRYGKPTFSYWLGKLGDSQIGPI